MNPRAVWEKCLCCDEALPLNREIIADADNSYIHPYTFCHACGTRVEPAVVTHSSSVQPREVFLNFLTILHLTALPR